MNSTYISVPLQKTPSGIKGFDEITFGGLPRGRPILVCGGAGSGKTLFGMEFLVRGAIQFGERGVFMSFEENETDLTSNFASLGFDLKTLEAERKLSLDYVHVDRSEIEETGEYSLEGLFIRLGYAVDAIGAKRVVLDTLEALFSAFPNDFILRSEIRRLFRWLKDRGLTTVITAERGEREGALTRHGLEEYVSDCVIFLDHRVNRQISTRRLRVVKYRGTTHGTNEYPFLIDEGGISVLPITSVNLDYAVSTDRISTGIPRLDGMFDGKGYYRGGSVLLSGTAGSGKTIFSSLFANETCLKGKKCLYYAFEESSLQIIRNIRSIGVDLEPWVQQGLLHFEAARPTLFGIEMHLARIHRQISEFRPDVVIMDPISNLISIADPADVKTALMRLVDLLKSRTITSLFTHLIRGREFEETEVGVSSLMDTWILLREIESGGERNRGLYVIKSRGMSHSNQVREFIITGNGVDLIDVYTGTYGVLTGTARIAQEAREREEIIRVEQAIARKRRELEWKRQAMEARIAELRSQMEAEEQEMLKTVQEHEMKKETNHQIGREMARLRKADAGEGAEDTENEQ